MKSLENTLNAFGIRFESLQNDTYLLEWIDQSSGKDYDFFLRVDAKRMVLVHPIGRVVPERADETRKAFEEFGTDLTGNISVVLQNDWDLIILASIPKTVTSGQFIQCVLEICKFKERIIGTVFYQSILEFDKQYKITSGLQCDFCGRVSHRMHVFESMEVCPNCYLKFSAMCRLLPGIGSLPQ